MGTTTFLADIAKASYVDWGDKIKTVVYCHASTDAFIDLAGKRYRELYNDREPFDRRSHTFLLDKQALLAERAFHVTFLCRKPYGILQEPGLVALTKVVFDPEEVQSPAQALASMDRGLTLVEATSRPLCPGAQYTVESYQTAAGEPVVAYVLAFDPGIAAFSAGTPNGTYEYRNQKQTVMEEALFAQRQGQQVLAAFNADFFDMFGDCAPSGLCVKDGIIVANHDSTRYFFGLKKDGTHLIDTLAGQPWLLGELAQAVAGRELLLQDGTVADVAVGERFGCTPHPRTAVGIREDGKILVTVIDGRRPWHSNGATLLEVARLLQRHGAVRGLNLDGGGSSTFIVRQADGSLQMLNQPADLERPQEDLIRDVFDSILIVQK